MTKNAKNAFGAFHKIKEREREFSNAASFHLEQLEMYRVFNMRINVYMFFRQMMRTSSAG